MQSSEQIRARGGQTQLHRDRAAGDELRDALDQFVHAFAGLHGNKNRVRKMAPQRGQRVRLRHFVDLVEDHEHLLGVGAEIRQHAHGGVVELHHLWLRGIEDVDEEIGERRFFERGVEGFHQLVRQVAHEADRIGQQERLLVRQRDLARGGVERGEEFVFDENLRAREPAEER